MSIQVSRQGSKVVVRQTQEVEETLSINDLHAHIEQCKRHEEMYRAKADEWAAKRVRYQQILYETLGEELGQKDESEAGTPSDV